MAMLVRLLPANAYAPISVMPVRSSDPMSLRPAKAPAPMRVTVSGSVKSPTAGGSRTSSVLAALYSMPPSAAYRVLPASTTTDAKEAQSANGVKEAVSISAW